MEDLAAAKLMHRVGICPLGVAIRKRCQEAGALVPHKPFLTATFIMYGPTLPSFRNLLVLPLECRKVLVTEKVGRNLKKNTFYEIFV